MLGAREATTSGHRWAKLALVASLAGCAPGNGEHEQGLDEFFSLDRIHTVEIEVADEGVDALLEEPKVYVAGEVTVDGSHYDQVGVRLKGSAGSFVALDGDYPEISGDGNGNPGKSAFIVDFNRFESGQEHLGLGKLTINNLVQDPSGLHEFLGYEVFRAAEVPASRSGFAAVSFNGELKGLYALIETQDNDEFLDSWFGRSDGNLYEGQYGADLEPERWTDFDQDNGDDVTKSDLAEISEALDQVGDAAIVATLETHFDLDRYLAFAVTEIYLGHWDGYVLSANNYSIHHDHGVDEWTFMPWGLDQLFEADMGPYAGVMMAPGPRWTEEGGRVHELCLRSSECRGRLRAAFDRLFEQVEQMDLPTRAAEGRALIEEHLIDEAKAHGDPDRTLESLDRIDEHAEQRRTQIERWLPCLDGQIVDQDEDDADDCTVDCDPENAMRHPDAEESCNYVDDDCNGIVDDPAQCPKCADFEGPGGAAFLLCFEAQPWAEARQYCIDNGGELASIHDPETAEVLGWVPFELFGAEETWIGLADELAEGEFVWSDGSDLDFSRWDEESPAEGPDAEFRDCVVMHPFFGWRDIECAEPRAFVCGLPP